MDSLKYFAHEFKTVATIIDKVFYTLKIEIISHHTIFNKLPFFLQCSMRSFACSSFVTLIYFKNYFQSYAR